VTPLPGTNPDPEIDLAGRWDGESVHAAEGAYGAYLLRKVGRVVPALEADAEPASLLKDLEAVVGCERWSRRISVRRPLGRCQPLVASSPR
jgi:hypothetical protein